MAPGQEQTFTVFVDHFVPEGTVDHFAGLMFMPTSDFTRSGALEDIESAAGYRIIRDAAVSLVNGTVASLTTSKRAADAEEAERAIRNALEDIARAGLPFDPDKGNFSAGFYVELGESSWP